MPESTSTTPITKFLFNESMFPDAYIEYLDKRNKSVKSAPAKTGQTIFKWEGVQFHHISVAGNKVDFLLHDGIVICTFPIGKDRNDIYLFLEKHWKERIHPFTKYIDVRRDSESSCCEEEA